MNMTHIYGIVAHPVSHSLSPIMHNAAFKSLGIDAEYRAFDVKPEDLGAFMKILYKENIYGLNISMPHKEAVMDYVETDDIAKDIGAVNTIFRENDKFVGTNTDWIGIIEPLLKRTELKDKKVMIVGAGGAAKAACYGLKKQGADVVVVNRTYDHAESLATKFGLKASKDPIEAEIIINCTCVGLENPEKSPVKEEVFLYAQIAFDVIYGGSETKFIRDAKRAGALTISGEEMLLHQGYACFEGWTGKKAPKEVMQESITEA
ncbi:shikimate dehydrogenase [Candidatus Peregrinibacteria bacterium CG22_combo_CG10-13_8_21_14_all_44_10]|nr:MAG: shikimate dehydrogenase [Candidatus Peregrinibacteria bacterium CG2_30_44_17]PIP65884.1 MAG: shikimate dehydrogenase [Candidatus Peregrinibacteria bacterium CG22_combo_CG10-13_8_21_14_all_44_10]PIS04522.1 MAG: shikimate dehydrogenase [Candidatus Peregrinibacteria bacterium CG10_big_fil_rev_8_21_14_0_10_44_7]PIX80206.1 MAG: shikimate dehydrogenase [Candidatus Peregrinibacteria bacterium CG_4_10_14_3_um_filter_44_21]